MLPAFFLMSNVAHSLAGIAVLEVVLAFSGSPDGNIALRMLLGALAGNFPDWDTVIFELPRKLFRFPWTNRKFRHRGITHDILVCTAAGFGFAWLGVAIGLWTELTPLNVIASIMAVQSHLLLDSVDSSTGFMLFGLFSNRLYRLPIRVTIDAVVPREISKIFTHGETARYVIQAYLRSVATELRFVGTLSMAAVMVGQSVRWYSGNPAAALWLSLLAAIFVLPAVNVLRRVSGRKAPVLQFRKVA